VIDDYLLLIVQFLGSDTVISVYGTELGFR